MIFIHKLNMRNDRSVMLEHAAGKMHLSTSGKMCCVVYHPPESCDFLIFSVIKIMYGDYKPMRRMTFCRPSRSAVYPLSERRVVVLYRPSSLNKTCAGNVASSRYGREDLTDICRRIFLILDSCGHSHLSHILQ